jgi:hypothetical protein
VSLRGLMILGHPECAISPAESRTWKCSKINQQ